MSDPIGDALRRAVLLKQYENAMAAAVAGRLAQAQWDVVALLSVQDPTAVSPGRRALRLESLAKKADALLTEAYADVARMSQANLGALGKVSVDLSAKSLSDASGIPVARLALPTREQLRAMIVTDPIQGAVMGDWWKMQRRDAKERFRIEIRAGLARGEGVQALAARIRGTPTRRGVISQRQAEALVRTAVNEIHNRAAMATYASTGLVSRYEYVATLDSRTTPICRSLDGKRFRLDDIKAPRPPQHWSCRSTTIPLLDGVPAPQRMTYGEWLAKQPASVQDDILGPARGRLFRSGTTLDELVRSDGRLITLDELARRGAPVVVAPPPPPPRRAPGPAGPAVSQGLYTGLYPPKRLPSVKEVLAEIDALHGDGALPTIELAEKRMEALGKFRHYDHGGKPINILLNPKSSAPDVALAHEIGHFLDYSGAGAQRFASVSDPRFAGFRAAWKASKEFTDLQARKRMFPASATYLRYLERDEEVWARAYSQWLAARGTGPAAQRMRSQVDGWLNHPDGRLHAGGQWDWDDFEPIAKEIDALMEGLGWRD